MLISIYTCLFGATQPFNSIQFDHSINSIQFDDSMYGRVAPRGGVAALHQIESSTRIESST